MSKPTVTIHDIAREAGVSPSTVSRVLNGSAAVTAEKRDAVLAAVKRQQYRPNTFARSLKQGRTAAIGVLNQSMGSPFYGEVMLGIEQGLTDSGYHAMVASGNWRVSDELQSLELLLSRRVDALIITSGTLPDDRVLEVAQSLPVVMLGRMVPGLEQQCLAVQNEIGGYQATRYLISLGHRRIAHIVGNVLHYDAADRRDGYLRALHEADIPVDEELLLEGEYTELSGMLAMQRLLNSGALFTAVFSANDQMAYGARLALYRQGIRVPDDVSLVGFDNLLSSAYTTPPLTTVRQPTLDMGLAAARMVLALLDDDIPTPEVFTPELVIRESAALRR